MSEKGPIQVFFSSDENYAPHLATAIASVVSNAAPEDRVSFHILSCDLSPGTRQGFYGLAGEKGFPVHFLEPLEDMALFAKQVATPTPDNFLPDLTYYRLMMGSLFPELERILYLDCDLVVRKSLGPLWAASLEGKLLGAVEDQGECEELAREKELLGADPYLNSGVLLVDLEAWRARDTERRFIEFAQQNRDLPRLWHDQSLINAILKDEVLFLDRTWNAMVSNPAGVPEDPAVAHYTYAKPWKYQYRHVLAADEYWKYRKMTPWGRKALLDPVKKHFLSERAREAWRHPKQLLRPALGLERWTPALPAGLED
jgi:lipopolysaccharide biosynthesis glycosyltransferase